MLPLTSLPRVTGKGGAGIERFPKDGTAGGTRTPNEKYNLAAFEAQCLIRLGYSRA